MNDIKFERVSLANLYEKNKSVFAKNMGSYIGFFLLILLGVGGINKIIEAVEIPFLAVINQLLMVILFLGFTVYAFKGEKSKQGEFNNFFGAFQKAGGIALFQILQLLYIIITVAICVFIVADLSTDLQSYNVFTSEEVVGDIVENIVLFSVGFLLLMIPLLIFWLTPHHYVVSKDSIWKSFSVSLSVFQVNWVTYILLILGFLFFYACFGGLVYLVSLFSSVLVFIIMIPVGLFFFFVIMPMLCLFPYCFYSLACPSNDSFMENQIESFGSDELE